MFFEFQVKDRCLKRAPEIESEIGLFFAVFYIKELHVRTAPIPEVLTI